MQPLRRMSRHRMDANKFLQPNSAFPSLEPLQQCICVHTRGRSMHHSIKPNPNSPDLHPKPPRSRLHPPPIRGAKEWQKRRKTLFVRNTKNPSVCFVTNFMQILRRHAKLTNSNPKLPLSIYKHQDSRTCNITSADVENCIRGAAAKVFNLDPVANKAELQMWSSHSLRVGTCTTLYAMGFHERKIKHLLRWKSNTFMTYLRNLAVTSRRHNDALSDASCIPNFL